MSDWTPLVGILALLVLVVVTALLVMRHRSRVKPMELPDGDYTVSVLGVRETLQGTETVYQIDGPEALKGRRVTLVQGRDDDEPRFQNFRYTPAVAGEPIHICEGLGYSMLCGRERGKNVWEMTESDATCEKCLEVLEGIVTEKRQSVGA